MNEPLVSKKRTFVCSLMAIAIAVVCNGNAVNGNDTRGGTAAAVHAEGSSALRNCVVHRGDGVRGLPENSLEAALKAWGSGFIPECDVRYTAEKKVIAFHDGAIAGKPLNSYSWEWLKDYDIGSRKGAQWSHVRIPTWDAIFAAMEGRPEWRILADYKDVPPDVTAALAKKHGVQGQVYFCTGGASLIPVWKKANPEGKVLMWIWTGMWGDEKKWDIKKPEVAAKCEATLEKRLAEFDRPGYPRPDIVQVMVRTDFAKPGDPFAPSSTLLRKAFTKLKTLGIEAQAMPWTGGDKVETYERLWELGPDSFGTDYPEVLGEFLKRRGIATHDISSKARKE